MDQLFVNTPACESEHSLKVNGELPEWLNGNLFRLGPGLFDLDKDFSVNHWFDGAAILFRYSFKPNNQVTCRSVYLKTDAYQKMITVRRPVYTEFGTQAYPDTTKSMISRLFNRVAPTELTDNVHGNIYIVGKDLYCASETCNIWRVNPETLETECKVDLSKVASVNLSSSHPHTEPDGTIINIGSSFMTGLKYHIYKIYPNCKNPAEINNNTNPTSDGTLYNRKQKEDKVKSNFPPTKQIATLSSSWTTMFSYNHSFSVTKNYIILIEQPMLINMLKLVSVVLKQHPLREAFDWLGNQEKARFRVIHKESGQTLPYTFYAPAFFFLHTINAYEDSNHIVIDIVAYDNERVLDTFYLEKLRQPESTNETPCISSIRRYVLPIVDIEILKSKNRKRLHDNLTKLEFTSSRSEKIDENGISVTPEYLLNPGFEIPSINRNYDARDYEYIYGSGLFEKNEFSNSLVKFSVKSKLRRTWVGTPTQFTGEAVFIPRPDGSAEDDGLIVSTVSELAFGRDNFLIVLNAIDFKEVARIEMNKVSLCPTVHGLWVPVQQLERTIKSDELSEESTQSSEETHEDVISKSKSK